jgi:predicted NAD/FAD-binding protein
LHQASFKHLLTTPATIRAQDALNLQQGSGCIWFAGGWTQPYDSQESALVSAMNVAEAMLPGPRRLRKAT